jgi:hypothetical protein
MMRRRVSAAIFLLLAAMAALPLAWAVPIAYTVNSDTNEAQRQLFTVDLATGEAVAVGPIGFVDVEGLSFNADGVLYGVDDATDRLLIINLETGAATIVGNLGLPDAAVSTPADFGLSFDCDGGLWLASDQTQSLYSVDPESGAASLVAGSGSLGVPITGLAVVGDTLYGLGAEGSESLHRIDTTTGVATVIGARLSSELSYNDGGLAFDATGVLWGIADHSNPAFPPSDIFRIAPLNGAASVVATTITGAESLAIGPPVGCAGGLPGGLPGQPIPALSFWGLIAMLLVMLVAAVAVLRPRFS